MMADYLGLQWGGRRGGEVRMIYKYMFIYINIYIYKYIYIYI